MLYLIDVSNELKDFLKTEGIGFKEIDNLDENVKGLQVVEINQVRGNYLMSKLKIYEEGKLEHKIKNKIKVVENSQGETTIGGQSLDEMSYYMEKMFHPKYKNYLLLKDYLR